MTNAQTLRHQLREAGYCSIPCYGKEPPVYNDKKKNNRHGRGLGGWQLLTNVTDEMIDMWSITWPDATNTGVLTFNMPTLDIDILNEDAARACEDYVREQFEERGPFLVRIGKPPKRAIPFRAAMGPFKKITVNLIAPNEDKDESKKGQKIEFLCDGQQLVVSGVHPQTGKPYGWFGGELSETPREDLPDIREDEARALVDHLVDNILVRDFGYKRAPSRPKSNGGAGTPHEGGGPGDRDWAHLYENILEGRELHDSICVLAAKLIATGSNPGAVINQLRALMESSKASHDERWRARVSEIPAAVDSAVAKYGKQQREPEPQTTARSSSGPAAEPSQGAEAPRLRAAHKVFRKWLDEEYDIDVLDAVLATAASERLGGDPLWLLVVSGSGNAKTETVQSLSGAGAHVTSTIASEGALLSATSRKQKAKGATGGLLRKIGDRGILVIKDVTSILSADRHTRGPVLAALRETHDGKYERNVGSDGGQTLTWTGRIVIVGAVTTAWDTAHSVIAAMGDRFVIIRADSSSGRKKSASKAIRNTGSEIQMRKELAQVAGALIEHINKKEYALSDDQIDQLIKAADIVTAARTGVERDYRGEVIDAHALEMPTRFAKQLGQLVRGAVAIGMPVENAMRLALRCAHDSIPPLRAEILVDIANKPKSEPHEVHRRIGRPRHTVRRELEALHMLRLLQCEESDEENDKGKVVRTIYEYSLGAKFDRDTVLAMAGPPVPAKKD
jgi:hypothetical protein